MEKYKHLLIPVLAGIVALIMGVVLWSAINPSYKNCSVAHAKGDYNIPAESPKYDVKLDRDHDNVACEK